MFKIKKIITILIILTFAFCFKALANNGVEITQSSAPATVLQVIDTDAIKVSLDGTNEIAFVKLKGIKGNAFNEGFYYLTNTLLGEKVMLVKDGAPYFDGKWNYMSVFFNGVNISNELVANGYAIIDKNQSQGSYYQSMAANQDLASSYGFGIWKNEYPDYSSITNNTPNSLYIKDKVNINTASLHQLKTLLKGITPEVGNNIIYYRERNPFTTIQEIKFVKGFTKEIYDQNKNIMSVSTNINNATENELVTLGLSASQINSLIEYRTKKEFNNISELVPNIISSLEYNKIKPFINTIDKNEINYIISSSVANINASSQSYIEKVGLSPKFAQEIVNNRLNGYTYKTLMEIGKFKNNALAESELHKFEDNLSLFTNLNSSNEEEIIYLFGNTLGKKVYNQNFKTKEDLKKFVSESRYNFYKDAIYVNDIQTDYININTAKSSQIQSIGFSSNEASLLIKARPITSAAKLPINISNFNSKVSLYTNINKASRNELSSLGLNSVLINQIIAYRNEQPFATKDEIKNMFQKNNALNEYLEIEQYLVTR